MDKRKITLIKSGMKLFAEKGFHKTSVQEIASKAGISKGAFYLLFDSKESFILTAIEYFYKELIGQTYPVTDENRSPEELFSDQIGIVTTYIYNYRDFIMMLFQEDVSLGRHAEQLFKKMKIDYFNWLKENIKAIYGDHDDNYIIDAVIQTEGMLNGYFQWIVIDDITIDRSRLGAFMIERLDDLITGMRQQGDAPLVTKEHVSLTFDLKENHSFDEELRLITASMKKEIQQLTISEDQKSELMTILEMLQSEHRQVIIRGLLAHFQPYESLRDDCKRIAKLFQIDLLQDQ